MINLDDGLTLIGPGSEWFWTALSGVVVAASLMGLLRQVRLQSAQHTRDEVASLQAQWGSERMLRYAVIVAIAQRDGTPPEKMPRGGPIALGNFWEEVAAFTRTKYLNKRLITELMGTHLLWTWQAMEPFVQLMRQVNGQNVWEDFEWLAHEVVRLDPELDTPRPPSGFAQRVENLEELIAIETELRHQERRKEGAVRLLNDPFPLGPPNPSRSGSLAEFERDLIRERTTADVEAARARGRVGGRPSPMTPEKLAAAQAMWRSGEHDVASIARVLGVSRASV